MRFVNASRSRVEVAEAAMSIVMRWLELQGYSPEQQRGSDDESTIIVHGAHKDLLMYVRYCIQPGSPKDLSDLEKKQLVSRAEKLGLTACIATAEMDTSLRLAESVRVQLVDSRVP